MKLLCLAFAAISPLLSLCQKPAPKNIIKPFLNIEADLLKYEDASVIPGGSISVGFKSKVGGIGAGAIITQFKGDNKVYVPVFVDFIVYPEFKTIEPYAKLRVGKGVYTQKGSYSSLAGNISSELKGDFFWSPALGIRFPCKKAGINLGLAYLYSSFSSSQLNTFTRSNTRKEYTTEGFLFCFGITI